MEEIEREIKRISQQSVSSYAEIINITIEFLSKINNASELRWLVEAFKLRK